MQIKIELDVIRVTTKDEVVFKMNWEHLKELEKAIRIIRQLYSMESFMSIEAEY